MDGKTESPGESSLEEALPAGPLSSKRRSFLRVGRSLAAALCWCLCLAGVVVRLTIRDDYDAFAFLFYALQPAVMAALALLAACLLWFRSARRFALLSLLLAMGCAAWFYENSYYDNTAKSAPGARSAHLRVMFWNVGRGRLGWSAIVNELSRVGVPLIGLVEAESSDGSRPDFAGEEFADYQVEFRVNGMALLVRGSIENSRLQRLGPGSRCVVADVVIDGIALTVIVVDISSNPFRSRREAFRGLISLLEELRERPVLIMGDFNTPPDSTCYADLRGEYDNAFEQSGTGFESTWPIPVPVLMLDQMWFNAQIQTFACELLWSWRSDHRAVLAEIGILSAADPHGSLDQVD